MTPAILKLVDRLVGPTLISLACRKKPALPRTIRSFLIIRPGGIGDAVLLGPAIRALKVLYPHAHITILAEKRNGAVFSLCPAVDRVLHYDRPSDLLAAIRGTYDVVIDTEQWHRLSAVVARLTRAPISIGFATNERDKLFTNPVPYSHDDYEVISFFRLLQPLGINAPEQIAAPFLDISGLDHQATARLLGSTTQTAYAVIFPGASIPEKRWDVENFRELAGRLIQRGIGVVVVGGGAEFQVAEHICADGFGINLSGKTSLSETASVIAGAVLLVSGDSGVLHIAALLDKPTVSLFGSSCSRKWAPRGEKHIVIKGNLHCSPCARFGYTPKCTINVKCMDAINVTEVTDAVYKLLWLVTNNE